MFLFESSRAKDSRNVFCPSFSNEISLILFVWFSNHLTRKFWLLLIRVFEFCGYPCCAGCSSCVSGSWFEIMLNPVCWGLRFFALSLIKLAISENS